MLKINRKLDIFLTLEEDEAEMVADAMKIALENVKGTPDNNHFYNFMARFERVIRSQLPRINEGGEQK